MLKMTFDDNNFWEGENRDFWAGKIYKNPEYDFTLEDRYIVYHYTAGETIRYVVLDKNTGIGSEVTNVKIDCKIEKENYEGMIHDVLSALKYTGDRRYLKY